MYRSMEDVLVSVVKKGKGQKLKEGLWMFASVQKRKVSQEASDSR